MTPPNSRKVVLAGMIGNALEWYDFAVYGYFAVAIGHHFFPREDEVAQLLAAFGVFALAPSLWLTVVAMALMGAASGGVRPATMARLAAVAKQARGGGVPTSVVARMETAFGVCNALLILVGGLLIAYASFETALLTALAAYVATQLAVALVNARPVRSDPRTPDRAEAAAAGTSG